MSERREQRRLHARARTLGVPIEQARRRRAPRSPREPLPVEPAWPRTELPERDEAVPGPEQMRVRFECCAATRTREVLAGGTVVMLTVHAPGCAVWAAR